MNIDLSAWKGRVDATEGDLALRWHQVIRALPEGPSEGVALVGFACDEGVRRNQGRLGARRGPAALRQHLSNLPVRKSRTLVDAGTVDVVDGDLEAGQGAYAQRITEVLDRGLLPIGLGGGHEIAFGTWCGLADHLARQAEVAVIGVLNLDAHFDLRSADQATSGTPFRQVAEDCARRGWPFHYGVLGISAFANTEALFQRAKDWGVRWRLDEEMGIADLPATLDWVEGFCQRVDHVYLTCCLDVLPASVAPGVSAPSARGVPIDVVEKVLDRVGRTGKLRVADLAELNPLLDEDGRTARVAARLVARIAEPPCLGDLHA